MRTRLERKERREPSKLSGSSRVWRKMPILCYLSLVTSRSHDSWHDIHNETVSRQNLEAGNTAKSMTSQSNSAPLPTNRDFRIQRRGRQRERQKTIGLISKTTTSHVHHAFLYISLRFLHDYDVTMPNLAFYGGRKQATTKFSFSFWAWIWSLEIQLQEGSPTFDKVSE